MTLNEVAVQLWAVAARIPCELCEIKGGSNILPDGGCRHRSSKEALMTALEAVLRISRALKLPIVVGRDPIPYIDRVRVEGSHAVGTKWRDYYKEIVAEAQAEGPEAVAHLEALSAYYRAHARMLEVPLGEVRRVTRAPRRS